MAKKLIRLTENDLHRIIENSVKRVLKESQLNELDWRTYANASRKWADHLMQHPDDPRRKSDIVGHTDSTGTHDITTDNRLRGFNDAMRKSFNDEYGYNALTSDEVEKNGLGIRDKEGYYEMPFETDNIGMRGYYDHLSTETGTNAPGGKRHKIHRMEDQFDLPNMSNGETSSEPHRAYNKNGAWSKERRYDMGPVDDKFDSYPYMKARNRGNKAIMDYQKNGWGK